MDVYKCAYAEGTAAARAMNDLEEQGYDVWDITFCGSRPIQNRLDPKQVALVPMFLITGRNRLAMTQQQMGTPDA